MVEKSFILDGPTVFPFLYFDQNTTDEDSIKELYSICSPEGEDVWKTNLRRSLASMLYLNLKISGGRVRDFEQVLHKKPIINLKILKN
jgi:hypothetical protein